MSEEGNNTEMFAAGRCNAADTKQELSQDAGAAGDHSSLPQDVKETNMKTTTLDDMPKHRCGKPGDRWVGFAPLDFAVMKAMADRDASAEEVRAQMSVWIAAEAARNPQPTEPETERFASALRCNIPFVVFCGACLEPICLMHPERIEDEP